MRARIAAKEDRSGTVIAGAAAPTDKLFTGYQRHGQTSGLYYAGARFYSADIGRFISPDPLGPAVGDPTTVNPVRLCGEQPDAVYGPDGTLSRGAVRLGLQAFEARARADADVDGNAEPRALE